VAERAVITGGAGFIGLHLARRLLDDGMEVTLVDDFSRGQRDAHLGEVSRRAELVSHDLTTPIPDDLLPGDATELYHLAAVVGVVQGLEAPWRVLRTNVLATFNVLDWCLRRSPPRLFLSSTSEVADGAVATGLAEPPVSESAGFVLADLEAPRSSYALSKVVSEQLCRFAVAGRLAVRIGRYFNIYGPRMGCDHVIPQLIERVTSTRGPLDVYSPAHTRSFCFVSDAVDATVRVMRLDDDRPVVVNIGNDQEEVRMDELAGRILAIAGQNRPIRPLPPHPGSPARRRPDIGKLRALTGFAPSVALDDGLAVTWQSYTGRPAERPDERIRCVS
jgi:UDP-glucose 4-epimerase/UDP-glucuronate decarboxylase